jgi:hypothetical protein
LIKSPKNRSSTSSYGIITKASPTPLAGKDINKQQQDPIEKFKNSVSRFARTNDKKMMLRLLNETQRLKSLPMESMGVHHVSPELLHELQMHVAKTNVSVNGAPLAAKGRGHEMLTILSKLCDHLTEQCNDITSDHVYQQLLLRLDRTTASADAYFELSALIGCADLTLQQPKKAPALQTDLSVYVSDGTIHAIFTTRHPFGLFRKTDLTGGASKRPWIRLVASVHERLNMTTGASVRYCTVRAQDK